MVAAGVTFENGDSVNEKNTHIKESFVSLIDRFVPVSPVNK